VETGSGKTPYSEIPGHQGALERRLEHGVVLLARVIGVVACGVAVYAGLVFFFFLCCGIDGSSYVHPGRSPFGPAMTVLLVWPAIGLLCVASEALFEAGAKAVARLVRRALHAWHRPPP
jgi:hypothetical protein